MNPTPPGVRPPEVGAPTLWRAYLTAEQVADLLQVSPKSVFRWANEDASMPALRVGGRTLRFPRERLLAWLRAREQGPGRARRSSKPLPGAAQVRVASSGNGGDPASCANPCATEALQEPR